MPKIGGTQLEKSKEHGEVFTPFQLIEQMCDAFPKDTWYDKNKTWLDPCAGRGQMPSVIVTRLMKTLSQIENEEDRYKHIMEKMIYMGELQKESCRAIQEIFNPKGDLKLNLYCGDILTMPGDFFDLNYEERLIKYSNNCIQPIIYYK